MSDPLYVKTLPDPAKVGLASLQASLGHLERVAVPTFAAAPIAQLNEAADAIRQVEASFAGILADMASIQARCVAADLDAELVEIQGELSQLLGQGATIGSALRSLGEVIQDGQTWVSRFDGLIDRLAENEAAQRSRAGVLRLIAEIDRCLATDHLSICLPKWRLTKEKVESLLDAAGSTEEPDRLLREYARTWLDSNPTGSALAAHYRCSAAWPAGHAVSDVGLIPILETTDGWIQREMSRLLRSTPGDLPPLPIGEPWIGQPLSELAIAMEIRLGGLRSKASGVSTALLDIAALIDGHDASAEVDLSCVDLTPLKDLLVSNGLNAALVNVLDRYSGVRSMSRYLEPLAHSALVAISEIEPLSRVSGDGPARGISTLKTLVKDGGSAMPLHLVLHIWSQGATGPTEFASQLFEEPRIWRRLFQSGPMGAWLVASLLECAIDPPDAILEEIWLEHGSDLATVLPFTLLSSIDRGDAGFLGFCVALELASAGKSSNFGHRSSWTFARRFQDRFPNLCRTIEKRLYSASPDKIAAGHGETGSGISDALAAARQAVRPRKFRGIVDIERISRHFVDDIAKPILLAAEDARSSQEIELCLEQLRELDIDGFISHSAKGLIHPPEGRLRKALVQSCEEMVQAIDHYLQAAQSQGSQGGAIDAQALSEDLSQLATYGHHGDNAATLLRRLLVDRERVEVGLPGSVSGLLSNASHLPRCRSLWMQGLCELNAFASAIWEDLNGSDPMMFALKMAEEGDVGDAEGILDDLRDPRTAPVRSQVAEIHRSWQDLVDAELADLQRLLPDQNASEANDIRLAVDDACRRRDFGGAVRNLEELRALAANLQRAIADEGVRREAVGHSIDQLMAVIRRSGVSATQKTAYLNGIIQLSDAFESDTALSVIEQRIEEIRSYVERAIPLPPEPVVSEVLGARADTAPEREPEPVPADSYFGVVKAVKGNFGFVVPLHAGLLAEPDLYFHASALQPNLSPRFPRPGDLVEFQGVRHDPSQVRPSITAIQTCNADQREIACQRFVRDIGDSPSDLGLLSLMAGRPVVITLLDGILETSEPMIGGGTFVRYALETDTAARIVAPLDRYSVSGFYRQCLERLAARPTTAVTTTVPDLSYSALQELSPGAPHTIRLVTNLHEELMLNGQHARLAELVRSLRSNGAPSSAWLQAMFVYSILTDAISSPAAMERILEQLIDTSEEWCSQNADADVHRVLKSLAEFASHHPELLSWRGIYQFFKSVQHRLGPKPHFRIELVMARLQHEAPSDESDMHIALYHVDRALVLNPRVSEAQSLRERIRRAMGGSASPVATRGLPSDRLDPSLGATVDPVEVTKYMRDYYRALSGRRDLVRAREFFATQLQRLEGVALSTLVLEHANFLLACDQASEAEDLLVGSAVRREIVHGETLLNLLGQSWTALAMPYDRVEDRMAQVGGRFGPEVRHLVLRVLAQRAFDVRKYDVAFERARESYELLATTEARELIRRAEGMMSTSVPPLGPAERLERAREEMNSVIAGTEEPTERVIDLVLGYMPDAEVGPKLVREAAKSSRLDRSERLSLVKRAQAFQAEPSLELFLADIEVRFGDNPGLVIEQQRREWDEALLAEAVRRPNATNLTAVRQSLDRWSSFAAFDCLARQFPDNPDIHWQRALTAQALDLPNAYFDAVLQCLGAAPDATPATIANHLLSLKLFGLSLAVAEFGGGSPGQPLHGIVEIAARGAELEPWAWPSALQLARHEFEQEEGRHRAANGIVGAILAAPTHWPVARTFLALFTPLVDDEDGPKARILLDLGLAVVGHLRRQPRLRDQPELLVLEAELRLSRALLDSRNVLLESARSVCSDLCSQAQRAKQAFEPAILLQTRLTQLQETVLAPGETFFNRYRIVQALPAGAFGQVYRAQVLDPRPDEPETVALKFVRADAQTPERREQRLWSLEREARIALCLDHPHIVRTFDFVDRRCLVMEFIDGWPLESRIESRITIPWQNAAVIGFQIAKALFHAQEVVRREFAGDDQRDFAHRDIHPGNIMVMDDALAGMPHAKLLDFGLARLPGGTMSTAVFNDVNRRLPYRPPEYEKRMDFRGDMFSLGVILYELVCGQGPYESGRYTDFQNNLVQGDAIAATIRPIRTLVRSGDHEPPVQFERILLKMTAFRTSDRYGRWEDLIDELARLIDLPVGRLERAV